MVEESTQTFDNYRYSHCAVFYLDTEKLNYWKVANDLHFDKGSHPSDTIQVWSNKVCCIYNRDKTEILFTGENAYEKRDEVDEPDLYIDSFLDKLYAIYDDVFVRNMKRTYDKDVMLLIQAFIAVLKDTIDNLSSEIGTTEMRYVFIVPDDWDDGIRDNILRNCFIKGAFINKDDHLDRLQFFAEIDCKVQLLQTVALRDTGHEFTKLMKKNRHCIIHTIDCSKNNVPLKQTATSFKAVESKMAAGSVLRVENYSVLEPFYLTNIDVAYRNLRDLLRAKDVFEKTDDDLHEDDVEEIMKKYLEFLAQRGILEVSIAENGNNLCQRKPVYRFPFQDFQQEDMTGFRKEQKQKLDCINENDFEVSVFSSYMEELLLHIGASPEDKRRRPVFFFLINPSQQLLCEFLSVLLPTFGERHKNEVNFVVGKDCSFCWLDEGDLIYGALQLSFEKTNLTDAKAPVDIIDIKHPIDTQFSLKPEIIINIDISYKIASLSFTLLDAKNIVTFGSGNLVQNVDLYALEDFLKITDQRQILGLNIKQWVKDLIDLEFPQAWAFFSMHDLYLKTTDSSIRKDRYYAKKRDPFLIRPNNYFMNMSNKIQAMIHTIFSKQKQQNGLDSRQVIDVYEDGYKRVFLMFYMKYLVDVVYRNLERTLGQGFRKENARFVITLEKRLFDNAFGSREHVKEIAYACGMLRHGDGERKLRILTQGEGIFSRIQEEYNMALPLKSFYIQAQLYEDYLYISLNQVVKQIDFDAKEDVTEGTSTSIVIKSNSFPLENIFRTMAKQMLAHIECDHKIHARLCSEHIEIDTRGDLSKFTKHFKYFIFAKFVNNSYVAANTDRAIKLRLRPDCDCHIYISYRDVLDLIIMPSFKNAVSEAISISTSRPFYGYYQVDRLFFINCFLRDDSKVPRKDILEKEMQLFVDKYLEDRRILMQVFIVTKSIQQLIISREGKRHFMSSFFSKGCLQQVFSKSFGLQFSFDGTFNTDYDVYFKESGRAVKERHFPLVVKRGEPVSDGLIVKNFLVKFNNDFQEGSRYNIYLYVADNDSDVLHTDTDGNSTVEGLLSHRIAGRFIKFFTKKDTQFRKKDDCMNISVMINVQNYDSSIKISVQFENDDDDDTDNYINSPFARVPAFLSERLTLAYMY